MKAMMITSFRPSKKEIKQLASPHNKNSVNQCGEVDKKAFNLTFLAFRATPYDLKDNRTEIQL